MEILILKSAVCLAVLMVFYKLFLENLTIHKFKRFYLLGALVVSIVIPFITFIKYVEPSFDVPYFDVGHSYPLELLPVEETIVEEPINYLTTILWSIYGFGVLLFASKFCVNLFGIVSKINKNEKQKHNNFISVLLNDLIVPHTFFSYIFLNKTKFETKAIPEEVLLHEQTHASQKHSLDILFIELFQIIFWFNPLLYFIKKDIKLNHEFLADEAVLKQGIDSSTYQETLLQFTSNVNEIPLAHAINYSLIKKRFTIMKTQTSKKAVWFRSLLLIPLLGGLLFSFSSTKEVEKEIVPIMETIGNNNPVLEIEQNPFSLKLNKKQTSFETLKKDFIASTNGNKSNLRIEAIGAVNLDLIKKIMSVISKDYLLKIKLSEQAFIEDRNDYSNNNDEEILESLPMLGNSVCDNCTLTTNKAFLKASKLSTTKGEKVTSFKIKFANNPAFSIDGNKFNQKAIKQLEKDNNDKILIFDIETINGYAKSTININVKEENSLSTTLTVNGIVCDGCELNLSKNGVANIILGTTTGDDIASFKIKIPKNPSESIKGNTLNKKAIGYLNSSSIGTIITLFDIKTANKEKLKPILITLVDKNDENYSQSPVVKKGEKSTLPPPPPPPAPKVMKGQASNIPPPPAPPIGREDERQLSFVNLNGSTHVKVTVLGNTKYYNRKGYLTDKNGNELSKAQVDGSKVIPGQKITKMYRKGKLVAEFKKTWEDEDMTPPPPPPPISTIDYVISMAKKGASFFYDGEAINSDKAIDIVKNNSEINISSHTNNGKSTVHLSTKPISIVNGKASFSEDKKRLYNDRQKALKSRKKQREKMLLEREEAMKTIKETRKDMLVKRKKEIQERKKMLKAHRDENRKPLAEQFKGMEENGGEFFFEGEKISESKAIKLIKKNPKLNVSMHNNNGKSTVHLSKKGIKVVNGRLVKEEK